MIFTTSAYQTCWIPMMLALCLIPSLAYYAIHYAINYASIMNGSGRGSHSEWGKLIKLSGHVGRKLHSYGRTIIKGGASTRKASQLFYCLC